MLDANPYRSQVYTLLRGKISFNWFRTGNVARRMAASAEYDAWAQKAADEQYDSAAEQTARLLLV